MKIYSALHIGEFHTNHCEDFLVSEQAGTNKRLIAVLDGCTMGTESVFASILFGKSLRNIAKKFNYTDFLEKSSGNLETRLKEILKELFTEIKSIKNQLGLDTNELLSTLIIGLVDEEKGTAEFLTVGDGLISVDGDTIEYEQEDKPDYLGYHLGEDFETWFNAQNQKLSVSNFKDLSISTDGIFTFKNLTDKKDQKTEKEIINYLLNDLEHSENPNFLERKIRWLATEQKHVVTDDIAIVRIIKTTPQQTV